MTPVIGGLILLAIVVLVSQASAESARTGTYQTAPAYISGAPHDYDNQIIYALNEAGIRDDFAYQVAKAIMVTENPNLDPSATNYNVNGTWDVGLMQVNISVDPGDPSVQYLFDPNQNILAACRIFASCWRTFAGDYQSAVRCYNGGPQFAVNAPDQTAVYLSRVQANLDTLRAQG